MVREGKGIEIIAGLYGKGMPEQNELVDRILGKGNAAERFALYFHWYNLIHELGHGVMWFYSEPRPHPVDEEVLLNQFAVAYWKQYGEAAKLKALEETLAYALRQYDRPACENVSAEDYAKENWGKETLYNFNNYGWFQMSCVADTIRNPVCLRDVLVKMGVNGVAKQPEKLLCYELGTDTSAGIVQDAGTILREWGIALPDVRVTFDDDPNRHMCSIDA